MQVIIRLTSGLGNQLFQYAAGLYYAKRYGADLKVSCDIPKRLQSRGYPRPVMLQHFSITAPIWQMTLFERLIFTPRVDMSAFRGALGIQFFDEPHNRRFTFMADVPFSRPARVLYLRGIWQTFRLLEEIGVEARSELAFRKPAQGKNLQVLEQIKGCKHPVSLHVRRGDYMHVAEGQISLPIDYYRRAISIFKERFPDVAFFVFSDDMPFVKENLSVREEATFVDYNDSYTSYEDLRLMSSCHHHIIANSTFSWWGAWLNPRSDKIVVSPKHWRLTADSYFPGLLSSDWILLDTVYR